MLRDRVITTLWAVPITVAFIWFGDISPLFTVFVAFLGLTAITEFYRLVKVTRIAPQVAPGVIWTVLLIAVRNPDLPGLLRPYLDFSLVLPALVTIGAVISLIALLTRKQKAGAFPGWAWTVAGILYVGWLLGYIVALRGIPKDVNGTDIGRNFLFLAIFCTFGSDITAFFIGRAFGKHKMAPGISPGKTWEGAFGGLLGAVLVSLLFLLPTPIQLTAYLNWWQAVVLGLLVSAFGQMGDLVESLFKRNVSAKDSGKFFPGHGGMLDRLDSVVFAIVVVYYGVICITR